MKLFRNEWRHPRKAKWQLMTRLDVSDIFSRFTLFRTPWLEVFFNLVHKRDPSQMAHDHPWSFLSILLRGSYTEVRLVAPGLWGIRRHRWFNLLHHTTPHRIDSTDGFLSLCIALPRKPDHVLYDPRTNP